MERSTDLSQFEELMNPLDIMIALIFKREVVFQLDEFHVKYGNTCLTGTGALTDFEAIIKHFVARTIQLLSTIYLNKIKVVLNDDGLIYYIYTHFYTLATGELEEKLDFHSKLKGV